MNTVRKLLLERFAARGNVRVEVFGGFVTVKGKQRADVEACALDLFEALPDGARCKVGLGPIQEPTGLWLLQFEYRELPVQPRESDMDDFYVRR